MEIFLSTVGRKLAEVWVTQLVLPGLLLVTTAGAGTVLGHARWFDLDHLDAVATEVSTDLGSAGGVAIALASAGVLLAAGFAGLLAQGMGVVVGRLQLGSWPRWAEPLRRVAVRHREARWREAHHRYRAEVERAHRDGDRDQVRLDKLASHRNRIALAPPTRPTWTGDRVAAIDQRVYAEYQLDLVSAWARLWLVLPDPARTELREARAGYGAICTLAGWGLLYVLVGAVWWPAAVAGLTVLFAAWWRSRQAVAQLADLAESAIDLYGGTLARQLGLAEAHCALTPQLGAAITARLRKGT